MKKIIGITLILALIAGVSFTGCNKYEDGPTISLLPKKMRLVNEWETEKVFYNGVEQAASASWENETVEFKSNGDYVYTSTSGSSSSSITGSWEFDNNKEELLITTTIIGLTNSSKSKILRLKSNELWLEYTDALGNITVTHMAGKN